MESDPAKRISSEEYERLLWDPSTEDAKLRRLMRVVPGARPLDFHFVPDAERVAVSPEDLAEEDALRIGNRWCRWRRARRFLRRRRRGDDAPVLVSEGDSWFQFPLLVDDVVDHLNGDHNVWSVGAAGDTAAQMAYGGGRPEFLDALKSQRGRVRAFLFSAAGNDVIGEDPGTGQPALLDVLRPFNGNADDIDGHLDRGLLEARLGELERAYRHVIESVRKEPGMASLPILLHGYDYVFPYPFGARDRRSPVHAARDAWLGAPLAKRGIRNLRLRRALMVRLIDELYGVLERVAGDARSTGVWVVECRGALPGLDDWLDEIHPTSRGFGKIADRFRNVLRSAWDA